MQRCVFTRLSDLDTIKEDKEWDSVAQSCNLEEQIDVWLYLFGSRATFLRQRMAGDQANEGSFLVLGACVYVIDCFQPI